MAKFTVLGLIILLYLIFAKILIVNVMHIQLRKFATIKIKKKEILNESEIDMVCTSAFSCATVILKINMQLWFCYFLNFPNLGILHVTTWFTSA